MKRMFFALIIISTLGNFTYAGWDIRTVDPTGNVGSYTSVAIDSSDDPHIVYYDIDNGALRYARWTGATWQIHTADSSFWVGTYTSLALDSNNYPHISYYDLENAVLRYTHWTGSEWQAQTVDSQKYVGYYTSIALDTNDYPHISYCDQGNTDLKYARWTGSEWLIETVDSTGYVGGDTSLALDADDFPHISYYDFTDKDLKYAYWDGSTWQIQAIDSNGEVGWYTSLCLDANNYPHISYYDITNSALKYTCWTGSAWQIQTIDSDGDVGWHTSIAVDMYNYPHISYYDATGGDLKYAWWNGLEWLIETADAESDVGTYSSLALDGNNLPHISYYDETNSDLKYAHWSPMVGYYFHTGADGWTSSGQVAQYDPADITDADGHLGLTAQGSSYCFGYWQSPPIEVWKNKAYVARFTVGTNAGSPDQCPEFRLRASQLSNSRYWATGVVSSGGASPSAANPKTYDLIILPQTRSWTDNIQLGFDLLSFHPEDDLYSWIYLEEVSLEEIPMPAIPEWQVETVVASGWYGSFSSIALDFNNFPHISFHGSLKYARWSGSKWEIQTVDSWDGRFTSIALDVNNYPHISYYKGLPYQSLNYARWNGSEWETQAVDYQESVGMYSSIALDSHGSPHISYYDDTNEDLKYARWNGSEWKIQTVDSQGTVGWHTSIALDSSDNPHISYFDNTNRDLKYARWTGSEWEIQTVDSHPYYFMGYHSSIALDSNDYPHITHYGGARLLRGYLKYARWNGSEWLSQIVASYNKYWDSRPSIVLDSDNFPHISYCDETNEDLKYARWNGSFWEIQIVDLQGKVGIYSSIALDSSNSPHISYYDSTNKDLKYASLAYLIAAYRFDSEPEGWIFNGNVTPFDPGSSDYGSGHIGISPGGSDYSFAFWYSPPIQIEPEKEYGARWKVSSSAQYEDNTLEFRLRANQQSNWRYWVTGVVSQGRAAPSTANPKSYDLIILPQTTTTDTLRLSFDLMSFNPEDDLNSWIYLENTTLQEITGSP